MNIKGIGNTMKLLRQNKKWSLEKESSMLGIHRNTMAFYEDNPENMSIGLFNQFLIIHNISRENFFKLMYDNSLIFEEKI